MKIGIITQPLLANYGGILQNFAMQRVLAQLGHEPRTIDYTLRNSLWRCLRHRIRHYLKGGKGMLPGLLRLRSGHFERFVERHIALTRRVDRYEEGLIQEYWFDLLLVGSDQVWRPKYNPHLEDMFLRFAQNQAVGRIAYAASFGVDRWEFNSHQTRSCAALAQRFDKITVREASGIKLCHEKLGVEAELVLDPTLLLTAEDYRPLYQEIEPEPKPYLAAYLLGHDQERRAFCEAMARARGLEVRYFGADANAKLSIEEWLSQLNRASLVITDSFHGTVFSILGHREFITLGHQGRGLSRLKSLLGLTALESRLFEEIPEGGVELPSIEWKGVDERLDAARQQSLDLLKKSLDAFSSNTKQ